MEMTVCAVEKVPAMILFRNATHVLSLLRGRERNDLKMPRAFNKDNWLFLEMDDVIHETAEFAPTREQVAQILDWGRNLPQDAKVVVHCWAGVSRSTAAALALKVQELGVDRIDEAVKWLVDMRPIACPNPVITQFADELLNANGKLHEAAEEVANSKLLKLWN